MNKYICFSSFFRLRENCEALLFTYSEEYGRKAEELLWRKVFYDLIQKLKYFRKVRSSPPDLNVSTHNFQPEYEAVLSISYLAGHFDEPLFIFLLPQFTAT